LTSAVFSPIGRHFHIFYPNFVRAARKRGVECADELIFIPDHRCIAQVFRPIGDRNRTAPQRQHKAVGQREIVEADAQVGGDPLVRLQCMDTRAAVPAQRARKALAIRRAECKIAHIFRELARRRFERRTLRGCAQRDTCPLRRKAEPRHRAADDLRRLCHAQRLFGRRQDTTARKYLRIWIILGKHGITHTALLQVFCCALGRKCSKHSLAARCVGRVKAHAAERARAVFLPRVPIADQSLQNDPSPQKSSPPVYGGELVRYAVYQPLI